LFPSFISFSSASSHFVSDVRGQCFQLNTGNSSSSKRLDDFIADLADYFYYLNDVFQLNIVPLANILSVSRKKILLVVFNFSFSW
jgi:hypothetical protein